MTAKFHLNNISPAPGSKRKRKRVGRGMGSGTGKTCGRGHKGQKSRSGGSIRPGFEGGQMPLQKRVPKYGFTSRVARVTAQVRTGELNQLSDGIVDIHVLKASGLIGHHILRVKIFLSGNVEKALNLKGLSVTTGACQAIEQAGGTVQ